MIRDPEIAALRDDLERLGIVVAPHRDHLCVRLPLFASVRVRVDEQGRLDCEPMFGPLSRTRAVLFSTTLLTATALGLFYFTGVSPLSVGAAFLSIMSGLGSVWRFVLTENCITRVQLIWAARMSGRSDVISVPPHRSIPALRPVEVPPPDLTPPQRIPAERKR
jgi:hypothetical protein